jgi:hypothetical protein
MARIGNRHLTLVLALGFTACAEQPLGPAATGPLFDHVPPEWASSSFDLHDVTDLAAVATGSDVELTWTSTDNYTDVNFFAADGGLALTKWHFEVHRRDNGADVPAFVKIADTQNCAWDSGALECEYVDADLADGNYSYFVKAFAREGNPGPNVEIHHSHDSNVATVDVGGLVFRIMYRFPPVGLQEARKFNRNGGSWNFQFVVEVKEGGIWTPISDCTTYGITDITFEGLWTSPSATSAVGAVTGCEVVGAFDPDRAVFTASISNANKQNTFNTGGTFEFTIESVTNENTVSFTGVIASQAD